MLDPQDKFLMGFRRVVLAVAIGSLFLPMATLQSCGDTKAGDYTAVGLMLDGNPILAVLPLLTLLLMIWPGARAQSDVQTVTLGLRFSASALGVFMATLGPVIATLFTLERFLIGYFVGAGAWTTLYLTYLFTMIPGLQRLQARGDRVWTYSIGGLGGLAAVAALVDHIPVSEWGISTLVWVGLGLPEAMTGHALSSLAVSGHRGARWGLRLAWLLQAAAFAGLAGQRENSVLLVGGCLGALFCLVRCGLTFRATPMNMA